MSSHRAEYEGYRLADGVTLWEAQKVLAEHIKKVFAELQMEYVVYESLALLVDGKNAEVTLPSGSSFLHTAKAQAKANALSFEENQLAFTMLFQSSSKGNVLCLVNAQSHKYHDYIRRHLPHVFEPYPYTALNETERETLQASIAEENHALRESLNDVEFEDKALDLLHNHALLKDRRDEWTDAAPTGFVGDWLRWVLENTSNQYAFDYYMVLATEEERDRLVDAFNQKQETLQERLLERKTWTRFLEMREESTLSEMPSHQLVNFSIDARILVSDSIKEWNLSDAPTRKFTRTDLASNLETLQSDSELMPQIDEKYVDALAQKFLTYYQNRYEEDDPVL